MVAEPQYAVAMACDAGYAPYALFLADQIARTHPCRDFDICIFSREVLTVPPELGALGVRLELLPANPFESSPNLGRHGAAAYLKLLIAPLVAHRYRRLLYLDCDIYLNGAGLDQLFTIDMLNLPIAAVRDNQQWRSPDRHVDEFKVLRLPAAPYFNSGVMLIDVGCYQSERILDRCLEISRMHAHVLHRHDQSLLNLVLKGRWSEISPVWNWQYTKASRFYVDLIEPRLIHFIGARKPWRDSSNELPARYRKSYITFLSRHYPTSTDLQQLDADAVCWPKDIRAAFLKHLIRIKPMKRYLDRFKDAFVSRRAA